MVEELIEILEDFLLQLLRALPGVVHGQSVDGPLPVRRDAIGKFGGIVFVVARLRYRGPGLLKDDGGNGADFGLRRQYPGEGKRRKAEKETRDGRTHYGSSAVGRSWLASFSKSSAMSR